MRRVRLLTATTAALLVASLFCASLVLADTPAQRATALTLGGASQTRVKGQVALSATLTVDGGKPLSNQSIDFYEPVQLWLVFLPVLKDIESWISCPRRIPDYLAKGTPLLFGRD